MAVERQAVVLFEDPPVPEEPDDLSLLLPEDDTYDTKLFIYCANGPLARFPPSVVSIHSLAVLRYALLHCCIRSVQHTVYHAGELSQAMITLRQMMQEGFAVARCTVERLMQGMGLQGVIRGKTVRTTIQDKAALCPRDRVNRIFHAPAPTRLWLSDFTYVRLGRASSTWPS